MHDYCVVSQQLQCRMVIASKQHVPVMMSVLLLNNVLFDRPYNASAAAGAYVMYECRFRTHDQ